MNKCNNIRDPKARKACLARAKKSGNNPVEADWGGMAKWGFGKMMEDTLK